MKILIFIFLSYAYAERDAAILPSSHPYQAEQNMKEDTLSLDKMKKHQQEHLDNSEAPANPDQQFEFMQTIKENQNVVK